MQRSYGLSALLFVVLSLAGFAAAQQQDAGSVLRIATVGEPPTLDSTSTTANISATIAQHMFETLYTYDENWDIVPMLADDLPQISDDGLTLTIPLRTDVPFHNGQVMTAEDVVASLNRWQELSSRGQAAADAISSITPLDESTVEITLERPYSPLVSYLAMSTAAASILPKDIAERDEPLSEYVGTGPFQFVEWRPDRYIRLERFEDYAARTDAASGYGGERSANVEELRFIPVPDATTRVAGLLGGEYEYADNLNSEALPRLVGDDAVEPVTVRPFAFPVMIINTAEGALTDVGVRQALQAALDLESMLLAAFGDEQFYSLEGSYYPPGSPFYTSSGTEQYNNFDPDAAREMLEASAYSGEPIRIVTSQQYEFLYRMSLVAAENLRAVGFEVDLQVVEWATLTERRTDPAAWEAYWTYGGFIPEPTAYSFLVGPGWGNWHPEVKQEILDRLNAAYSTDERVEHWSALQTLLYEEVPVVKVGDFYNLAGKRQNVVTGDEYVATPNPYFWNVALE